MGGPDSPTLSGHPGGVRRLRLQSPERARGNTIQLWYHHLSQKKKNKGSFQTFNPTHVLPGTCQALSGILHAHQNPAPSCRPACLAGSTSSCVSVGTLAGPAAGRGARMLPCQPGTPAAA